MKRHIVSVLKYFQLFGYPPSFDEIYIFLQKKVEKKTLNAHLFKLLKEKVIIIKYSRYALGGHSNIFGIWKNRKAISKIKYENIAWFFKIVAHFTQIKLLGISGALAMKNCSDNDDIDVFIISKKDRIWTARFILILLSSIFGLRRSYKSQNVKNKLCFNLFFSEEDMQIFKDKQNLFVAHEVIQMKPVVDHDNCYRAFLLNNDWIFKKHFPNLDLDTYCDECVLLVKKSTDCQNISLIGNMFENLLKKIQLFSINRHRTNEVVRSGQLWFFPDDFEKKISKKILK